MDADTIKLNQKLDLNMMNSLIQNINPIRGIVDCQIDYHFDKGRSFIIDNVSVFECK